MAQMARWTNRSSEDLVTQVTEKQMVTPLVIQVTGDSAVAGAELARYLDALYAALVVASPPECQVQVDNEKLSALVTAVIRQARVVLAGNEEHKDEAAKPLPYHLSKGAASKLVGQVAGRDVDAAVKWFGLGSAAELAKYFTVVDDDAEETPAWLPSVEVEAMPHAGSFLRSVFEPHKVEALGDRMKRYEAAFDTTIPPEQAYIVRLDGCGFSKFTASLEKPFDPRFVDAMNNTATDLLRRFNARTAYCHSDEITLMFAPAVETEADRVANCTHLFNGRVQKLVSCMAGYCSARFNHYVRELMGRTDDEQCFDARVMTFDGNCAEIVNHQVWRSVYDCYRNCVSTYARAHYSARELHGKTSKDMVIMLADKGVDWDAVPLHLKHGTYHKRVLYDKLLDNGATAQRTQVVPRVFKVAFSEEMVATMLAKYWSASQIAEKEDVVVCK